MDGGDHKEQYSHFQFKYFPVHIIGLYGFVLHALLLNAFAKDPLKCFRNSATYLVANLAVSDLVISLCGPYLDWFDHWILDMIRVIVFSASLLTIISIAADRFLMVVYPLKHKLLVRGKKIIIFMSFIWSLSSLNGIQETLLAPMNIYTFSFDTYLGVAIMLVTGSLYVLTLISLRKQTRTLALDYGSGSNRSQATRLLREKQFVRTILLVACIAVIGTAPFIIVRYTLAMTTEHLTFIQNIIWCFVFALFYFTFATNPLIYFVRLPRYRKTFCILYLRKQSN